MNSDKTFIDLFAGAGCLSLGLMKAGWQGVLAIEKDPMAFETLNYNLITGKTGQVFNWPNWFPKRHCTVNRFLSKYESNLYELRGKIALVAGGPPCQGFSFAGRRNKNDKRNSLFKSYMQVVKIIDPLFVLIENVQGITLSFNGNNGKEKQGPRPVGRPSLAYSERIKNALAKLGYNVYSDYINASDFGVPQYRKRYFIVGIKKTRNDFADLNPFDFLTNLRANFLISKNLPVDRTVNVGEALSDLEIRNGNLLPCEDSPRFFRGSYNKPTTSYQKLLRGVVVDSVPDSHRIPNHRPATRERLINVLASCPKGSSLRKVYKDKYNVNKHTVYLLSRDLPSPTLTTLPDDVIHYNEPRTLSVREYARLQSIPDWFQFRGNYTTGGKRRKMQCPRYTQIGNAVPPLLGEALGLLLFTIHNMHIT